MRIALLLSMVACGDTSSGGDAGLAEAQRIALPGVSGRIDHLVLDAERGRLCVCALGNGTVEVIDVAKGQVVKSLAKLDEPQGVALIPATKQIAVATGGDGKLHVFDAGTLAEAKTLDAGGDADNVRFDPKQTSDTSSAGSGQGAGGAGATNGARLWVGCNEGLVAFTVADWKRVATVKLAGHAESFQLEAGGARLFANVPSARHVAVVDRDKGEVVATWPLDGASSNFPMALDEKGGRLYVGCRSPAELLALDLKSGKVVAKAAIGGDCDDLFVDGERRRIYASCGEGVISVLSIDPDGALAPAGTVATESGARTSLFVPSLAKLFVAIPKRGGHEAEVRVFTASAAR